MVVDKSAQHMELITIMGVVASANFFNHLKLAFDSISLDQKSSSGSRYALQYELSREMVSVTISNPSPPSPSSTVVDFVVWMHRGLTLDSAGRGSCLSRGPMQHVCLVVGWGVAFGRALSDFEDLGLSECPFIALATFVCVSRRVVNVPMTGSIDSEVCFCVHGAD